MNLALAATAVTGVAQASDVDCLTRTEAASLMMYALPDIITGTTERCRQALPSQAFLPTNGNTLAQRYARQRDAAWPAARAAFAKFAKSGDLDQGTGLFSALPQSSQQQLVSITIQGLVAQGIALDQCNSIDTVIGLMAQLPPESTTGLLTIFIDMAANNRRATSTPFGGLTLCRN